MTLLEIEAFLAVVKCGTISTAAQNLFITQPALTRRIQLMEQELGYPLFKRQKGHRTVQLTEQGAEFYHIAWKWQRLWEETNSIAANAKESLAVAAVGSVNHHLLSRLYPEFIQLGYPLLVFNIFSEEAYQQMERGFYDVSFIELQDYTIKLPADVQSKPTYSEAFSVVTYQELPNVDGDISIECLSEREEVYIPWNKEFKSWHANHFDERIPPVVTLDDTTLASYFLHGARWLFAPYTFAERLRQEGARVYKLLGENPPNQIIYRLVRGDAKCIPIQKLLDLLDALIGTMPQDQIRSFLH